MKKLNITLIVISVIFILFFIPRAYNAYQNNLKVETVRPGTVNSTDASESNEIITQKMTEMTTEAGTKVTAEKVTENTTEAVTEVATEKTTDNTIEVSENTESAEEIKLSKEELVYPDFFEVQDGYDPDIAAEVLRYYYMIPENVRSSFENNGWKVICSATPVEEICGFDYSIRGCTDEDKMVIYINNKECTKNTIIHEMGHYIEYVCDYPEHTDEFAIIYNEEVNTFLSETSSGPENTGTVCEYFAEAYYQIVQEPSVKDKIPKTYEYIMEYVNEI